MTQTFLFSNFPLSLARLPYTVLTQGMQVTECCHERQRKENPFTFFNACQHTQMRSILDFFFQRKIHVGQLKLWHMIMLFLPNETTNLFEWNTSTRLKKSTSIRRGDIYFSVLNTYITLNEVPGIVLQIMIHSILIATLCSRYYFYFCFISGKMKTLKG